LSPVKADVRCRARSIVWSYELAARLDELGVLIDALQPVTRDGSEPNAGSPPGITPTTS
jgi:hypothetical protein